VNIANRITLFRVCMIPVFCLMIFYYGPEQPGLRLVALCTYFLLSLTDGIDGYIARNFNQRTRLGTRLDPLADKLLVNLGFTFLAANVHFQPGVPQWFPALLLGRDIAIVMGAWAINRRLGQVQVRPTLLGKTTTVFQMATMIGVLMQVPFVPFLILSTTVLTLLSLGDYVAQGVGQLRAQQAV
jgi:cardiolipin synthase